MKNQALVIQDSQNQSFDCRDFMGARNLIAEHCTTGSSALSAFKSKRYKCVVVSMDMEWEDPLAIISGLRSAEIVLGLSPTQILVAGKMRQPTQSEIARFNISAQIRSHRMS